MSVRERTSSFPNGSQLLVGDMNGIHERLTVNGSLSLERYCG